MARDLLSGEDPPTAILAGSDVLAIAASHIAEDLGLNVPGDISIVGFDGIAMSRLVSPPLTTVEQPIYAMARLAADLLLERVNDRRSAPGAVQMLQPTLRIGRTTGRPR